jgi:hypothetical protein
MPKALHGGIRVIHGCDHYDSRVWNSMGHGLDQREPAHAGHHDIAQQQIDMFAIQDFHGLEGVRCLKAGESMLAKDPQQPNSNDFLIIHNQNADIARSLAWKRPVNGQCSL